MLASDRRQVSPEVLVLAALGLAVLAVSVFECLWAFHVPFTMRPDFAKVHAMAFPKAFVRAPDPSEAKTRLEAAAPNSPAEDADSSPFAPDAAVNASLPPAAEAPAPLPPARPVGAALADPPLPPTRPDSRPSAETPFRAKPSAGGLAYPLSESVLAGLSTRYDRFTAVYDLSAHTVYLPNGVRLEAHSGLGDRLDNPLHVDEPDRGATPPHLYELTPRESLFHGVQALRLNPVGGPNEIFGRAGLLAHTYMLGPNGDSNGCVSFKDYDAFLQAFQSGVVKRLAVVARLN